MSYLRWSPMPSGRGSMRSGWRFFPAAVILLMGVVVAVNGGMIYVALRSFPGQAGGDEGFALSNHYDAVLDQAQREATLGWNVSAAADAGGRVVVTVADRSGAPLTGAALDGFAERPLGETQTQSLAFHETAAGRYAAAAVLPMQGQWELTLSISAGGHDLAATRRVVVR